jgi:hypothetical protein
LFVFRAVPRLIVAAGGRRAGSPAAHARQCGGGPSRCNSQRNFARRGVGRLRIAPRLALRASPVFPAPILRALCSCWQGPLAYLASTSLSAFWCVCLITRSYLLHTVSLMNAFFFRMIRFSKPLQRLLRTSKQLAAVNRSGLPFGTASFRNNRRNHHATLKVNVAPQTCPN